MDTERDVGVGRDLPPFGMLLRRYRRQADLTQEGLAARAHVSLRGLSDLERGVNHAPRPDTARLLADALGLMGRERAAFEAAARRHGSPVEAAAPPFGAMRPGRIAPVLVAREHELALLQRHLDGVGPPVLLLAGEPGMGKSRLLREAALSAGLAGWRVLAGGCQRRGGQEPFAPLMEALTRHIRGQTPRQLRAQLQGCAWLIRLLPELRAGPVEPLPAWTVSPEHERRLMFDAVGRLLANLAGPAGTLLALDDLQWAGQDALDLLAALVRAPLPVPLRVVGAYRDTEVRPDAPLGALLGDLAQAGLACQRTLAPLDAVAAAQLLDQLLAGMEGEAGPLRERVIARAGGVPFFLVSYAQALRDGVLDRGHGALGVPWDLAQGVRQRVAALPPIARDVLGVAAVVGRVAPRALLVAVAGRPVGEVLDALEATRQAHLLEEVGPAAYRFAHDVIREVVEADLGAGRRSLTHARVAEALEQGARAPDAEVVAYHYAQTDARARRRVAGAGGGSGGGQARQCRGPRALHGGANAAGGRGAGRGDPGRGDPHHRALPARRETGRPAHARQRPRRGGGRLRARPRAGP